MASKEAPAPAIGDYKSIAAQYARAKAIKEKEDAAKRKDDQLVENILADNGLSRENKVQLTAVEKINQRKTSEFKSAWNWTAGFFLWLL